MCDVSYLLDVCLPLMDDINTGHSSRQLKALKVIFHSGVCLCRTFPGSVSGDGVPGPSPELLASLQSLRDNSDFTLLPHSLHQVCVSEEVDERKQQLLFSPDPEALCLYLVFMCGSVCINICSQSLLEPPSRGVLYASKRLVSTAGCSVYLLKRSAAGDASRAPVVSHKHQLLPRQRARESNWQPSAPRSSPAPPTDLLIRGVINVFWFRNS